MIEDAISRNEFNGFTTTVREDFKRFGDQLTNVSSKLDTLVNGRIEEARVLGEITGAVRAINERIEKIENRMSAIEDKQNKSVDGKLRWVGEFIVVVIAAVSGAYFAKHF